MDPTHRDGSTSGAFHNIGVVWDAPMAKGAGEGKELGTGNDEKNQPKKDEVTVAHLKVTKTAYETLAEEGRWCALPRTEGIGPHGS